MRKAKENLIFLHLPKAGGSTFRDIIYRQYSTLKRQEEIYTINRSKELPSFLDLSEEKKRNIKILLGHFPYGIHQHLFGEYVYFSMLRNPVERVVSAYTYAISNPKHDYFGELSSKNISLEEYVRNYNFPWLENGQTKFLAGLNNFSDQCTEEVYHKALKNIDLHFERIGLLEYFDESILLFQNDFNWKLPFYKQLNESKRKVKNIHLTNEALDLIKANNVYDIALYNLVELKLQERIQEQTFFRMKLFAFQILNKFKNKLR